VQIWELLGGTSECVRVRLAEDRGGCESSPLRGGWVCGGG
jgi:hypothetical protein